MIRLIKSGCVRLSLYEGFGKDIYRVYKINASVNKENFYKVLDKALFFLSKSRKSPKSGSYI